MKYFLLLLLLPQLAYAFEPAKKFHTRTQAQIKVVHRECVEQFEQVVEMLMTDASNTGLFSTNTSIHGCLTPDDLNAFIKRLEAKGYKVTVSTTGFLTVEW